MTDKLRTNIAVPHRWATDGRFVPLGSSQMACHEAWLDALLKGGIIVPRRRHAPQVSNEKSKVDAPRALSVLLTGPAGTGKSTMALELCHRARYEDAAHPNGVRPRCLYVTSEANLASLTQQAASLGWKDFRLYAPDGQDERQDVEVAETTDFLQFLTSSSGVLKALGNWAKAVLEPTVESWEGAMSSVATEVVRERFERLLKSEGPQLLIIDSLNTAPTERRRPLFEAFAGLTKLPGLDAIVLILDVQTETSGADFWTFVSDMVIRLDRSSESGYMVRTIEVQKARYQEHVWGPHQLKIYGPNPADQLRDERELQRLQHPYREEGGIFIYPSIHYHLSRGKRRMAASGGVAQGPIPALNDAMGGGLPIGRCVGLVGSRGGHKSHIGYTHILKRLLDEPNEYGLIVSLRDAPGMAVGTMKQIVRQINSSEKDLDSWQSSGRLEIMYFQPGYITPEEFFHRVYVAVHRIKDEKPEAQITLMFNSLDQLGSRFPLCAGETIFIPGLIEMLSAEGVTSMFIGVTNEGGQPHDQYGLLSMADTVLAVERKDQRVILSLERLAGGRPGGAKGILTLDSNRGLEWQLIQAANN